jgi:hypothetical protein
MQFPILVISYGSFGADQKKLFFYEKDGVPVFPIFNDPVVAAQFCTGMQETIKQHGDERRLQIRVCQQPEHARDLLIVINSIVPELTTIIFDPSPPQGISKEMEEADAIPKDDEKGIDDVIQELELLSKLSSKAE